MNPTDNVLNPTLNALNFAAQKHHGQHRKDVKKTAYIYHPIALAHVLCNEAHITDVEVICGALLHDTVEDTDTTPEELEDAFGNAIRQIVMDVTDDKSLPKAVRKQRQIENAAHICEKAKLVKLADKISNLRDILAHPPVQWTLQVKRDYFENARRVVDEMRGVHAKLEEIFDAVYARRP